MSASVIICTKNRAQDLRETLAALALLPQMQSGAELIVVDNGSTDSTAEVVAQAGAMLPVHYLKETRGAKSAAINAGIAEARGDYLIFTDDDVRPAASWLDAVTEPLRSGKADLVAGGVRLAPHVIRPWMEARHLGMLAANTHDPPESIQLAVGANMAFHRRVLEKVPTFDVELGPGAAGFCEDLLFSWQVKEAGFQFATALEPGATVEHHPDVSRLTPDGFRGRVLREGRSLAYVQYHWAHQNGDNARAIALKRRLRLLLLRLKSGRWRSMPSWAMMNVMQDIAFHTCMQELQGTPRNYERRGLVKVRGAVLPQRATA